MARKGYSVGAERRQQIVDAAATRFAVDGYHRTAMTTIATDVGISEGAYCTTSRTRSGC